MCTCKEYSSSAPSEWVRRLNTDWIPYKSTEYHIVQYVLVTYICPCACMCMFTYVCPHSQVNTVALTPVQCHMAQKKKHQMYWCLFWFLKRYTTQKFTWNLDFKENHLQCSLTVIFFLLISRNVISCSHRHFLLIFLFTFCHRKDFLSCQHCKVILFTVTVLSLLAGRNITFGVGEDIKHRWKSG